MATTEFRSTVGLVLARGGSTSIPKKNLAILGGKSLLQRCIDIMVSAKCFDVIWVSTDDPQIGDVANACGVQVHWRKDYTATSTASSVMAVREFLENHEECCSGILCLVQCTSPFINECYLREGVLKIKSGAFDSVFSAVVSHKLRWVTKENGTVVPLNLNPSHRPQRQQWSGELCETGMFYMTAASNVFEHSSLQVGRVGVVEIPSEDSLDVDSSLDLFIAEALIRYKQENSNKY